MAGQILRTQTFNTAMENVTIKHNGEEYNIDRATLEKCKVTPKPTWDRMEVLRGEWNPAKHIRVGDEYFYLSLDGSTIKNAVRKATSSESVCSREILTGWIHFPTRELAEEYLLIGEGKWAAQKGDRFFYINVFGRVEKTSLIATRTDGGIYKGSMPEFPSKEQAESYIAKNKPVRPLAGKSVTITVDGTEYKATLQ